MYLTSIEERKGLIISFMKSQPERLMRQRERRTCPSPWPQGCLAPLYSERETGVGGNPAAPPRLAIRPSCGAEWMRKHLPAGGYEAAWALKDPTRKQLGPYPRS